MLSLIPIIIPAAYGPGVRDLPGRNGRGSMRTFYLDMKLNSLGFVCQILFLIFKRMQNDYILKCLKP